MYLDADDLEQLSSYRREFKKKGEDRNHVVCHLNKSLLISSPFGRFVSYINAFLDKYVELKN